LHDELAATAGAAASGPPPAFVYRRFGNAGASAGQTLPELVDASP
jgi:hypothetical protein